MIFWPLDLWVDSEDDVDMIKINGEGLKTQIRSSQITGNQRSGNRKLKTETRNPILDGI